MSLRSHRSCCATRVVGVEGGEKKKKEGLVVVVV